MGEVIHCEGLFQHIRKRSAEQQELADEFAAALEKYPDTGESSNDDPDDDGPNFDGAA